MTELILMVLWIPVPVILLFTTVASVAKQWNINEHRSHLNID